MTCGIYRITNTVNGKAYIGRSADIEARWGQHRSSARRGSKDAIHCALRKYGPDAFTFEVLEKCDALQLRERELAAINKHGTWAATSGYNVGGTNSGFPSLAERQSMPPAEAERWRVRTKANAKKAHDALRELRRNPEFEAQYRAMRAEASLRREKRIQERRAVDPEYDQRIRALRSRATQDRQEGYQAKAGVEFSARMAADPEYAEAIRVNRKRANVASLITRRAKSAHLVAKAVEMRAAGVLLKEIAKATGKTQSWASVVTRGATHAALP